MPNLSISQEAPKIALHDEGAKIALLSANHFNAGQIALLTLRFDNVSSNTYSGESFRLSWNGQSFTFTFVAIPDDSGLQLTQHDLVDSEQVFLDNLALELSSHFLLNQDFKVHGSMLSHNLWITARYMGDEFTLTLDQSDVTQMTIENNVSGISNTILSGFRVVVQPRIYTDQIDDSIPLGSDAVTPAEDGISQFDLAHYFSKHIKAGFQFPQPSLNVYTHPDGCLKYFVTYSDIRNGQYTKLQNTHDDPKYIVGGGLSMLDRLLYENEESDYFDYSVNAQRFLTWCPTTKHTTKSTPERLYFLNQQSTRSIEVNIEATERDGSTFTYVLASFFPTTYTLYEFVLDYWKLGMPTYKDVISYQIFLTDNGSAISETRTFILDETPYENVRHFIFKNSFDVYDSLFASGQFSKSVDLSKIVLDTINLGEFTTHKSTKRNNSTLETQIYSGNTGFVTKEHLDYLREFLLSEDVFLVLGDVIVPIVVTSTKAAMLKDKKHLYSLSFKFEYAFDDHRFSRDVLEEGFSYLMIEDDYIIIEQDSLRLRL